MIDLSLYSDGGSGHSYLTNKEPQSMNWNTHVQRKLRELGRDLTVDELLDMVRTYTMTPGDVEADREASVVAEIVGLADISRAEALRRYRLARDRR